MMPPDSFALCFSGTCLWILGVSGAGRKRDSWAATMVVILVMVCNGRCGEVDCSQSMTYDQEHATKRMARTISTAAETN